MDENKEITVAVIGAGLSGITAVKCSLDEGLKPTCFEQDDQIGKFQFSPLAARKSSYLASLQKTQYRMIKVFCVEGRSFVSVVIPVTTTKLHSEELIKVMFVSMYLFRHFLWHMLSQKHN